MASPFDYSIPAQKQNLNEERGFPEIREKNRFFPHLTSDHRVVSKI